MPRFNVTFGDVLEIVMADGTVARVHVREVSRGNRVKLAIDAPREVPLLRVPRIQAGDTFNSDDQGT